MASRLLPPSPVDSGLSRSSRDRPILGLAWRRASNQATTQASVHCICTAQATIHGRKTRPVAGGWCLGCVAAAAVPRRSVPSCPAVQLSRCPDSCPNQGPVLIQWGRPSQSALQGSEGRLSASRSPARQRAISTMLLAHHSNRRAVLRRAPHTLRSRGLSSLWFSGRLDMHGGSWSKG